MLTMKPAIGGFTTVEAEGHGFDFSKASIRECVRGRVERCVLIAVMPRERAARILEAIREALPVPHLTYWLEPVLEVGHLVEAMPETQESTAKRAAP